MHELISKLLLYTITGGIAAVVDTGGFALLINAKLNIALAGVISFCTAALVNYRLTSQFVFSREITIHGFTLFLFAALTGLTINVGVTVAGVYFFGLPPVAAKLAGIGTAFLINFGLNVGIVFRTKV
jgi:putative flippase GtrA